MDILNAVKQLRDDIKIWATNNLNALNAKIDEKTILVDSELSSTSTNPVQNNVITNAINNIPRFSGDYNDLTNAPNIAEDDSGNMVITDEAGNIIFRVDAGGAHTTQLIADEATIGGIDISYAIPNLMDLVGDEKVSDQISTAINEATADDFGIYVQATEPIDAVAGDIWIDTANDPSCIQPTIPEITAADNGKVLMVVNGTLQLVNLNLSIDADGVVSM